MKMKTVQIDAILENADWPKRTDDTLIPVDPLTAPKDVPPTE